MNTYRIVPAGDRVHLIEVSPEGRDVLTVDFANEAEARAWLLKYLGAPNLADLERWLWSELKP